VQFTESVTDDTREDATVTTSGTQVIATAGEELTVNTVMMVKAMTMTMDTTTMRGRKMKGRTANMME
jgi:hypothetical protein